MSEYEQSERISSRLRQTEIMPINIITDPSAYEEYAPRRPGKESEIQRRDEHIMTHMHQLGCTDQEEFLEKINRITSRSDKEKVRAYTDVVTKNIIIYDVEDHVVVVIGRHTIEKTDEKPLGKIVTAYVVTGDDYVERKLDGRGKGTPWGRFKKDDLLQ